MSNIIKQFSRFASSYDSYNVIQEKVATILVEKLNLNYKTILDVGCGSGQIFNAMKKKQIDYKNFIAFDFSKEMLDLHPSKNNIEKIQGDFNKQDKLVKLINNDIDILISSSALQWSKDLDDTLKILSKLAKNQYMTIFTSNTFKTLHICANVNSPIYTTEKLKKSLIKYYDKVDFELYEYKLKFDSVREMFKYIKKSGVSSGEKKLSYKETKQLMQKYPLDYLEFEVLFVTASND